MSAPLTARKSVKTKAPPPEVSDSLLWDGYAPHDKAWDELFCRRSHAASPLPAARQWLGQLAVGRIPGTPQERRPRLHQSGDHLLRLLRSPRRREDFPVRPDPAPVAADEWQRLETGLLQRIQAINLFLYDVYHDRRILREGVVPEELVLKSKCYRPEMIGFDPPGKQYVHVVRHRSGSRCRRPIPRPGRQWPHAVGRQLCAGKSRRHEEGLPEPVPAMPGAPRRGLSATAARGSALRRPAERRRSADASCC